MQSVKHQLAATIPITSAMSPASRMRSMRGKEAILRAAYADIQSLEIKTLSKSKGKRSAAASGKHSAVNSNSIS